MGIPASTNWESPFLSMPVSTNFAAMKKKKVMGLIGLSGSGTPALIPDLIAWFRIEGLVVSVIKHTHSGFDMDRPGKESYRMRESGAQEVWLVSEQRSVLMREYEGKPEPSLHALVAKLDDCDLVLIEGFRLSDVPKIEVYRPSLDKPPLWPADPGVVAVATDKPITASVPILDLNDVDQIGRFVACHVGLL